MVLPKSMHQRLLPSEVQFLSENELITILPRYSMKRLDLIGSKVAPLKAMRRMEVPLWVALILKAQDKCNIIPPGWLSYSYLKEKYEEEKRFTDLFSDLPWNWLEISNIILAKASDDLTDSHSQLRSLIQDLREMRQLKARRGLRELNESNIQLHGLSLMEINEIRPFVLGIMGKLLQLHHSVRPEDVAPEDDDNESDLE